MVQKQKILFLLAIVIPLYGILAYCLSFPNQGIDFFPIKTGIEQMLNGLGPYSEYTSNYLKTTWDTALLQAKVATVVAYPLPFLVALSPIILVPEEIMNIAWFCFMLVALGFALYKTARGYSDVLTALLFFPLFHALTLLTSSFLWLAIVLLCMFNVEERKPWFLGLLLVLLPLKPQMGLLFFPLGIYYCYKKNPQALPWILLWGFIIWGISFIISPGWIFQWIEVVKIYRLQAVDFSISHLFAILLIINITSFSLPALIAILSLTIFPINDIYSTILLIVFFRSLENCSAVPIAALTLGMPFCVTPNSAYASVVFIWMPVSVFSILFQSIKFHNKIQRPTSQPPSRPNYS